MAQNNNNNQDDQDVERLKQVTQRQQKQIQQLEQKVRISNERVRTLRQELDAIKSKLNLR